MVTETVVAEPDGADAEPAVAVAEPVVIQPAVTAESSEPGLSETESAEPVLSEPESAEPVSAEPESPASVEVDPNATQPFELSKVIPSRRPKSADKQDEAGLFEDADETNESLVDSGETRLSDFTSSGGFQIADEDPSGPALGSLPSAPSAIPTKKASGAIWWILAIIAVIAVALAFFLQ